MMTTTPAEKNVHHLHLPLVGVALFGFYYLADCALDSLLFGEETFNEQLFSPTVHEVAIRILSGLFLFALYVAASLLLNKNRGLQEELKKKSQELFTRNQELEAYNLALTNELGTSLNRVSVAKEVLNKRSGQCSDPICRDLIEQIGQGCKQLTHQIDSMLVYSEANRSRLKRRPVAIDNIAREIAKEVVANTKGDGLDIQIDNRLEVDCDPEMIYVALKNLIENAVKFRSPDRHGQIEIGSEVQSEVPVYYIRDNGLGLEQEDCERLFRPFEKLAHTSPATGGVGLATTKTIIERHGGKIWAESCPAEGTTIYFTLQGERKSHPRLN